MVIGDVSLNLLTPSSVTNGLAPSDVCRRRPTTIVLAGPENQVGLSPGCDFVRVGASVEARMFEPGLDR